MSTPLDRQAPCPNCGATLVWRFAKSRTQVCKYCKFLVARAGDNFASLGKTADLVELPSPFQVGADGTWGNEMFYVEGRAQLDRHGSPGAPWQEFYIYFPKTDRWSWLAFAQGRWYSTTEIDIPAEQLPPHRSLAPGMPIQLGQFGTFTVAEIGQRRLVSGEGELPEVAPPGEATSYADIAAPGGQFGTIDYGNGQSIGTKLFLGRQIDPSIIKLSSGYPVEMPEVEVKALECPNCGGSLPLITPGSAERIVCKYCNTVSDIQAGGALSALAQAPKPPVEPQIPLGQEGMLRNMKVYCIGFVVRGTTGTDGLRYNWREYLLYAGQQHGYQWLMEEDGNWQLISPIAPGEVQSSGSYVQFQNQSYNLLNQNRAQVEYVVGEFYWKVAVGEEVDASEFQGPNGKIAVERSATEIHYSFCSPSSAQEIGQAFNIAPPAGMMSPAMAMGGGYGMAASSGYGASYGSNYSAYDFSPPSSSHGGKKGCSNIAGTLFTVGFIALFMFLSIADCGDGGDGGVYIVPGGGFSGK